MALTVSRVFTIKVSNKKCTVADITFDSSYPAGGESLTPTQLGMTVVQKSFPSLSTNNYVCKYNRSTSKLQALDGDYSTSTDGPLQETATTDLSAETVRMCFLGY